MPAKVSTKNAPSEAKADTAPAPDLSLSFDDAEVPAVTVARTAAPNPFSAVVQALADSRDDKGVSTSAKAVTVPKEHAEKMIRQLQQAGKAAEVTVRSTKEENGSQVRITFWAVNKITRPRKERETAAPAENTAKTPAE